MKTIEQRHSGRSKDFTVNFEQISSFSSVDYEQVNVCSEVAIKIQHSGESSI